MLPENTRKWPVHPVQLRPPADYLPRTAVVAEQPIDYDVSEYFSARLGWASTKRSRSLWWCSCGPSPALVVFADIVVDGLTGHYWVMEEVVLFEFVIYQDNCCVVLKVEKAGNLHFKRTGCLN